MWGPLLWTLKKVHGARYTAHGEMNCPVIPAEAGIQEKAAALAPGFRRGDGLDDFLLSRHFSLGPCALHRAPSLGIIPEIFHLLYDGPHLFSHIFSLFRALRAFNDSCIRKHLFDDLDRL